MLFGSEALLATSLKENHVLTELGDRLGLSGIRSSSESRRLSTGLEQNAIVMSATDLAEDCRECSEIHGTDLKRNASRQGTGLEEGLHQAGRQPAG